MNKANLVRFLDAANIADRYVRSVILRTHSRRWPTWHAYSMRRDGDAIVEVAKWCREKAPNRFVVIRWSLATLGIDWRSFRTLKEARNCTELTNSVRLTPHA